MILFSAIPGELGFRMENTNSDRMKQLQFSQFNFAKADAASPAYWSGVGLVRFGLSSGAQCFCACALRICVAFPVIRWQRCPEPSHWSRKFGREGDMGDMDSIPPSWGDMAGMGDMDSIPPSRGDMAGMDDMGDMRTLPRD